MADSFEKHSSGLDSTGEQHFDITPSDSVDLAIVPRAVYVGGAGDIVLRDKKGVDVTYSPADNSYILIRATRVLSTGTTASGIIGVF